MAREVEWKAREVQRDEEIGWGEDRHPSSSLEGWPGVSEDDERQKEWAASESRVMTSYHSINCGWPSIEGGVEVTIEVCSGASKPEKECSTCRSLVIIDYLSVPDLLSFLYHSAVGTSFGSCAPSGSRGGIDWVVILIRYVARSGERGVGGQSVRGARSILQIQQYQ
jgi:hypothetical protein